MRRSPRTLWSPATAILALLLLAGLLALYPEGSDARAAAYDPLWYARHAERGGTLRANGVLHDVSVRILYRVGASVGVPEPAGLAVRLGGALPTVALLVFLLGLAAPRRRGEALALCALPFASHVFVQQAAVGETAPLGSLLAVLAIANAGLGPPSLRRAGAVLVLATLARQDNVVIAPVVAWLAVSRATPRTPKKAGIGLFLLATGLLSLAVFAAIWSVQPTSLSLSGWLLGVASEGGLAPWQEYGEGLARLDLLLLALREAWQTPGEASWPALGLLLLPLALARRALPLRPGVEGASLLAALGFVGFYTWFEPNNFERWHPVLALLSLAAVSRLDPTAERPLRIRVTWWILAGSLTAASLCLHAESTLRGRSQRLEEAANAAAEWARLEPGATVYTPWAPARLALERAGLPEPRQLEIDEALPLTLIEARPDRALLFFVARPKAGTEAERKMLEAFVAPFAQVPVVTVRRDAQGRLLWLSRPALP